MAETGLLELRSLTVTFGERDKTTWAVDDLSLSLDEGHVLGVVGESGSGKSVSVRAMLGLLPVGAHVQAGSLQWRDRIYEIRDTKELRRLCGGDIGFIPQDPFGALNPLLTVRKQFRIVLKLVDEGKNASNSTAAQLLERVGIQDANSVLRRYPFQLSGGMAQRVVIALVLARSPQVLVADEPTTGLDSTVQRQVLDVLGAIVAEHRSKAALIVTHDLGVVANYCTDIVVMFQGHVVEAGPMRIVLRTPNHPYTRELIAADSATCAPMAAFIPTGVDEIVRGHGCPYRLRCPLRIDVCDSSEPLLRSLGNQRVVACHRAS